LRTFENAPQKCVKTVKIWTVNNPSPSQTH
jgi:hypothetical protein